MVEDRSAKRRTTDSLVVATALSAIIVCAVFVLAPSTATVKLFLSLAGVTLVYPAAYVAGRRRQKQVN